LGHLSVQNAKLKDNLTVGKQSLNETESNQGEKSNEHLYWNANLLVIASKLLASLARR